MNEYDFERYGGKKNDPKYDNSPILKALIEKVDSLTGGTIYLPSGTYYFSTAIILDKNRINNVKICGNGISDINDGKCTHIIYTGDRTFITSEVPLWGCTFENLRITLPATSYGFNFKGLLYKSSFNNIFISGGKGKIKIAAAAYIYIDKITTMAGNTTKSDYDLMIGGTTEICEFIYISHSSFDGNLTKDGDAIILQNCNNVYLQTSDICNHVNGRGLLVQNTSGKMTSLIYVDKCNFIKCNGGIEYYPKSGYVEQCVLSDCSIIFNGIIESEKGIFLNDIDSQYSVSLDVRSLALRKIGSVDPQYFFEASKSSFCRLDVFNNLTNSIPCISSKYHSFPMTLPIRTSRRILLQGDGKKTEFTYNITSKSPYQNPPVILGSCDKNMIIPFGVEVINKFGKDLNVTFKFSTPPPKGKFFINYALDNYGGIN